MQPWSNSLVDHVARNNSIFLRWMRNKKPQLETWFLRNQNVHMYFWSFFFFLLYIILHTDVFYDTFKRQLCNYQWVLVFSVYLPLMNIIFHTHYIKRKKTLEIGFHRINNVQVTSSYLKFIPVEKLQSE